MKHRYAITVATTGLAATAAVASLGLTTAAGAATTAGGSAPRSISAARPHKPRTIVAIRHAARSVSKSPSYVVLDCAAKPQVRPSSYVLACADAGLGLESVRWTTWTPRLASGYGTFYENNCTPDCADGKIIRYPALATLWGTSAVSPASRRYTKLTLVFTGKRPPLYTGQGNPAYPLTQTFDTDPGHT